MQGYLYTPEKDLQETGHRFLGFSPRPTQAGASRTLSAQPAGWQGLPCAKPTSIEKLRGIYRLLTISIPFGSGMMLWIRYESAHSLGVHQFQTPDGNRCTQVVGYVAPAMCRHRLHPRRVKYQDFGPV